MRSVSRTDHPPTRPRRGARAALLPAAIVATALFFAAPGARAQSAGDAGAVADASGAVAFRGWLSGGAAQIDDQTLSRQRGGAVGMVMVAATPELMRGNGVTLWDEIAPPAPLPVPVDASQAAQGNIASYTRR
jgi:hypothetical protein